MSNPDKSQRPPEQTSAETAGGVTPEIMAVIHEAVRVFAGRNMRVVSVKLASELRRDSKAWASAGLNLLHESHNRVQRGR